MFRKMALMAVIGAAGFVSTQAQAHPPYASATSSGCYGCAAQSYAPRYQQTYAPAPTYSAPTYSAPVYSAPAYTAQPAYRGYQSRAYGRYYGPVGYGQYARNPYYTRPVNNYVRKSYGPYSRIPSTEGLNVGYAGGPTYGTDSNPVINGVELTGPQR